MTPIPIPLNTHRWPPFTHTPRTLWLQPVEATHFQKVTETNRVGILKKKKKKCPDLILFAEKFPTLFHFHWYVFITPASVTSQGLCKSAADAAADNLIQHSNGAFDKALATGSFNQWAGLPSPLLSSQTWSWEGALNWKLLHIKPSAQRPGSNRINILPDTINQMLSLPVPRTPPHPSLLCQEATGRSRTGTYLNFLVTN